MFWVKIKIQSVADSLIFAPFILVLFSIFEELIQNSPKLLEKNLVR